MNTKALMGYYGQVGSTCESIGTVMWTSLSKVLRNAFAILGLATTLLGYFGEILDMRASPFTLIAIGNVAFLAGILWTLGEQRKQIRILEDRLAPKFEILFGAGAPFEQIDTLEDGTVVGRLFRIGVKNLGGKTIEDMRVQLERMVALQTGTSGHSPLHPIPLHLMHDNASGNEPYQTQFTLNPGQPQYVDVVLKPEDILDQDSEITLYYAAKGIPNQIPCGHYELHILVTGRDVVPQRRQFIVGVDVEGRLLFELKREANDPPAR